MSEIPALGIEGVIGSFVTDDGQTMVLGVNIGDGKQAQLAIPKAETYKLVECAALSATQMHEPERLAGEKQAFSTKWFELGLDDPTGDVVLSLTFGAGATLTFRLDQSMANQIRETLNTHLGDKTQPLPEAGWH